jgi:hypothetical protein
MIPADRFYGPNEGGPKQGDILLAGAARLLAEDRFTPPAWTRLDAYDVTVTGAGHSGGNLYMSAGPALVMVTSHDCHFDKDWNIRRGRLMRQGVPESEAERQAEEDPGLDRTFNASPLLLPAEIDRDQNQLLAGKVVGYVPVPASTDGLVPEAVVDLTYRVTLDRLDDVFRVACITAEARAQLRYALVRLDSLRASSVGFEVEAVVGRQIEEVNVPNANPLMVSLRLDDGTTINLLQQPTEPDEGPGRTQSPGSAI